MHIKFQLVIKTPTSIILTKNKSVTKCKNKNYQIFQLYEIFINSEIDIKIVNSII